MKLTKQQRDAIAHATGHLQLIACAGSGKTEVVAQRLILEIYDAMAEAARTGTPYQTCLDPAPADPRVAHPDTRPAADSADAR